MAETLKQLRYNRTRQSNQVRDWIDHMLRGEDKPEWRFPNGLPSWWPFYSECLYNNVRELVRAGRRLEAAEAHAHNEQILEAVRS